MRRLTHVLSGGLLLAMALTASAAPIDPSKLPLTFEAIDAVKIRANSNNQTHVRYIELRGLVQGESEPRAVSFSANEECVPMATLAMHKPGVYLLELSKDSGFGSHIDCTLIRR